MLDYSYYEMRENKRHLSSGFPQAIHILRSFCVENCSNNAKSQPNLNFYIPPCDKQWRWCWFQAIDQAQQCLSFCTPR